MKRETAEPILKGLNEAQKAAVLQVDGPVLVVAGAGSGKTRVLAHRLAYLITQDIPASQILAITFTNKAAEELAERVKNLLGKAKIQLADKSFIGTFHSLAAAILRQECRHLGYQPNFAIFDDDDSLAVMKSVLKELAIPKEKLSPAGTLTFISRLKNDGLGPGDITERTEFGDLTRLAWEKYEKSLLEQNAFDFDNLLVKTVELFENHKDVLEKYQNRWRYVLVDEYQDTNKPQYLLIKYLAAKHGNLCAVGDDWQAIYGWRGADFKNILLFEKDWPEAKVVMLEENYRSTQTILEAAAKIIAKNQFRTSKNLWTQNSRGEPIFVVGLKDEREEADFIAEKIIEGHAGGKTLKDFAVLFRTNAQSRALEEAFIEREIPYQLVGGFKFYKRREVQDILAYLRLVANPQDRTALMRCINVPPRGIGPATLTKPADPKIKRFWKLIHEAKNQSGTQPLSQLLAWLIKKIGYEAYLNPASDEGAIRWDNVKELFSVSRAFDDLPPAEGLSNFLQTIALLQETDEFSRETDKVSLMTLHNAKGLEFPVVFIAGMEEGLLPHSQSFFDQAEMEEERRLVYVGLTRAKNEVYLTFAHRRLRHGEVETNEPSRFLSDIPAEIMTFIDQELPANDTDSNADSIEYD